MTSSRWDSVYINASSWTASIPCMTDVWMHYQTWVTQARRLQRSMHMHVAKCIGVAKKQASQRKSQKCDRLCADASLLNFAPLDCSACS